MNYTIKEPLHPVPPHERLLEEMACARKSLHNSLAFRVISQLSVFPVHSRGINQLPQPLQQAGQEQELDRIPAHSCPSSEAETRKHVAGTQVAVSSTCDLQ